LGDRDAAWVETDEDGASAPDDLPRSARWTYLRLRAPGYTPEALDSWRRACATFERAYVYFKHEDEALGPALAERLQAGVPPGADARSLSPARHANVGELEVAGRAPDHDAPRTHLRRANRIA